MGAGTEISLYLVRNLGALLLLMVVMRGVLHRGSIFTTPSHSLSFA